MKLNEIWGNENAKRAIEIACLGKHSIKFIGNGEAEMFKEHCRTQGLNSYSFMPCPCGNFGDQQKPCTCSVDDIKITKNIIDNCKTDMTVTTCRVRVSLMSEVKLPYELDKDTMTLLKTAIERMFLNQVEILSLLKVASTIASLERCNKIKPTHLAEALQYRQRI